MENKKNGKLISIKPIDELNTMLQFLKTGGHDKYSTGFKKLDKLWKFGTHTVTDITGSPTSGKTQFLFEILINISEQTGKRHLLFVPDVGTDSELIAMLLHKYTGKTIDGRWGAKLSEKDIQLMLPFVSQYFEILKQSDIGTKVTPMDVWKYAAEVKDDKNLISVVIDSWKDLYHDSRDFGREDMYLAWTLKQRNAIAEKSGLNIITVIHPTKPRQDKDGNYIPPTAYDLKGGSEWYNNGKTIIVINRPDIYTDVTEVLFQKVKPESLGMKGKTELHYDLVKGRYFEIWHNEKYYAQEYKGDINNIDSSNTSYDDIPF